jgi:hypothetical protein
MGWSVRIILLAASCVVGGSQLSAQDGKGNEESKGADKNKPDAKNKARTSATIHVKVKGDGVAVKGATVRAAPERGESRDKSTDKNGVASLSNVPTGRVRIQVVAPTWATFGMDYEIVGDREIEIGLTKMGAAPVKDLPEPSKPPI